MMGDDRPNLDGRWIRNARRPARALIGSARSRRAIRQLTIECNELRTELDASRTKTDQIEAQLDENRRKSERLEAQIKRLQSDLVRSYDDAQRAKRSSAQREESVAEQARLAVATRIMTVADDFSNALETAQEQNMDPSWFDGFKAMAEKIDKGLNDSGFRRFESIGEDMDPARHEALATMPTSDDQVGKVVQEIEAGYEDIETAKVVRVAKVLVGRKSDDSESS